MTTYDLTSSRAAITAIKRLIIDHMNKSCAMGLGLVETNGPRCLTVVGDNDEYA